MIGEGAYLNIENKSGKTSGKVYSSVSSIAKVPTKLEEDIWPTEHFDELLQAAEGEQQQEDEEEEETPKPKPQPAKKAAEKRAKPQPANKKAKTPPSDDDIDEDVPF